MSKSTTGKASSADSDKPSSEQSVSVSKDLESLNAKSEVEEQSNSKAASSEQTEGSSEEQPEAGDRPKQTPRMKTSDEIADSGIKRFAEMIRSGKAKNVVILTGAGISTSAGIPDFRSPTTGLYANLARLNLPFPEAVFELDYFKKNPKPFWTLAKELYPGKHFPTPTHYFFLLLERHNILRRVFTQNIDTLETIAGLDPSRVVEAHGSFASAHCLKCRKSASTEHVLRSGVRKGEIVKCGEEGCRGLVKPDIVFFGEGLPDRFFKSLEDLTICDLLIVIGTSLQVHPFASLPNYVQPHVPRLLINREPVGPFSHLRSSRSYYGQSLADKLSSLGIPDDEDDEEAEVKRGRDRFWEGDADDGVRRLAAELGWGEELEDMIVEGTKRLKEEWEAKNVSVQDDATEVAEHVGEAVKDVVGEQASAKAQNEKKSSKAKV